MNHFKPRDFFKNRISGEVFYAYDPLYLREVKRVLKTGDVLYKHTYEEYDEDGNLALENIIGDLGQISHKVDLRGQTTSISSPYFSQQCSYNEAGDLISNIVGESKMDYSYDDLRQLSWEKSSHQQMNYQYDSLYTGSKKIIKHMK